MSVLNRSNSDEKSVGGRSTGTWAAVVGNRAAGMRAAAGGGNASVTWISGSAPTPYCTAGAAGASWTSGRLAFRLTAATGGAGSAAR